jgi:hypothetical protein
MDRRPQHLCTRFDMSNNMRWAAMKSKTGKPSSKGISFAEGEKQDPKQLTSEAAENGKESDTAERSLMNGRRAGGESTFEKRSDADKVKGVTGRGGGDRRSDQGGARVATVEGDLMVDMPEEVLLGLMSAIKGLSTSVRHVSNRLDVLAAISKASASQLENSGADHHQGEAYADHQETSMEKSKVLWDSHPDSVTRFGGSGGALAAPWDPIRQQVHLNDPGLDAGAEEGTQTPTTQMLAATAEILAAVASSRALSKSPLRVRSDYSRQDAEDGVRDSIGIPAQKQMGRGAAAAVGGGGAGIAAGEHEPYVWQHQNLPRSLSKPTLKPERVARLDSSMQVMLWWKGGWPPCLCCERILMLDSVIRLATEEILCVCVCVCACVCVCVCVCGNGRGSHVSAAVLMVCEHLCVCVCLCLCVYTSPWPVVVVVVVVCASVLSAGGGS